MSTEEKLQKLKEARVLIAEPEHWRQWIPGERRANHGKRCALEAVGSVFPEGTAFQDSEALRCELRSTLGGQYKSVSIYNDSHTHAEVLQLFDDTISRLEASLQGAEV